MFDYGVDIELANDVSMIILSKYWRETPEGELYWECVVTALCALAGSLDASGYFNDDLLTSNHGDEPMKFTDKESLEILRLAQEISINFEWDASPQGYEFWWQIHEALKKCVEPG